MKMFHIIFAMDKRFGIGLNGGLPWPRNPTDMSAFYQTTTRTRIGEYPSKKNVVIMGRKTWESIPATHRPLNNRLNVILTRNPEYDPLGQPDSTTLWDGRRDLDICPDLNTALERYLTDEHGDVFVIGGAEVYNLALRDYRLGEVFVTEFGGEYQADTYIDRELIDPSRFSKVRLLADTDDGQVRYYWMKTYDHPDAVYAELCRRILLQGESITGRNGGVSRITGDVYMDFSLMNGIPVLTGKKILWSKVVEELLFFIRGDTDTKQLEARNVKFWQWNTTREFLDSRGLTEYPEGEMGPMYGFQWRHFNGNYQPGQPCTDGHDQLRELITEIKTNPTSRRLLLTTFNPCAVGQSVLWPCHGLVVQFFVDTRGGLSCKMYQRSADVFLGLPFNMASYALLTCILARLTDLEPRSLHITIGDCHIYDNHVDAVNEYLSRVTHATPRVRIAEHIRTLQDVEASSADDYPLEGYTHSGFIRAPMSA